MSGPTRTQQVSTDAQGNYTVPDSSRFGNYEAQASRTGLPNHRAARHHALTVGAQAVVDFSMMVGQSQQTITVEAQVSAVDTGIDDSGVPCGAETDQRPPAERTQLHGSGDFDSGSGRGIPDRQRWGEPPLWPPEYLQRFRIAGGRPGLSSRQHRYSGILGPWLRIGRDGHNSGCRGDRRVLGSYQHL